MKEFKRSDEATIWSKHCPPCVPQHWTRSPHSGGPPPKGDAGCPTVVSGPFAFGPASSAGSPQSAHDPRRRRNLREQPARSSPPVLTPGHGPARPSSGESAWGSKWKEHLLYTQLYDDVPDQKHKLLAVCSKQTSSVLTPKSAREFNEMQRINPNVGLKLSIS